jgi:hypothetical protein
VSESHRPRRPADHPSEEREVRSDDPGLSPRANALLTEELRQVVGTDRVRVPAGTADAGADRRGAPPRRTLGATLATHRIPLGVSFAAALVIGAIVAFATGSWWFVVLAAGLHAAGTLVVATGAIRMTTLTEHAAPETAARLQEEGVADPDRRLTELVQEFTDLDGDRGASETLSRDFDEQTVVAGDDPARAAVEHRTAMTPASEPVAPAGIGARQRPDRDREHDPAGRRRRLVAFGVAVVAAVVVFVVIVGLATGGFS